MTNEQAVKFIADGVLYWKTEISFYRIYLGDSGPMNDHIIKFSDKSLLLCTSTRVEFAMDGKPNYNIPSNAQPATELEYYTALRDALTVIMNNILADEAGEVVKELVNEFNS